MSSKQALQRSMLSQTSSTRANDGKSQMAKAIAQANRQKQTQLQQQRKRENTFGLLRATPKKRDNALITPVLRKRDELQTPHRHRVQGHGMPGSITSSVVLASHERLPSQMDTVEDDQWDNA